jgi:biopolymer transport protein ExbB
MRRPLGIAAVLVAIALVAGSLLAREGLAQQTAPSQALSLDQLLEQVRKGRRVESRDNQEREARFRAAKSEQQHLLKEARAARVAEERQSEKLERSFDENELKIAELEEQLRNKLGTLGELFGVVRQVAGDTRGHLEASLVSAQLPGRDQQLGVLAESKSLPSIEQLEGLWFALQQEMTESGKVVRFPATVVTESGEETQREVIRIGVFNAVADGKYLRWLSDVGKLAELGRQPASRFLDTVSDLERASEGLVRMAVDPGRGSILNLLVQTKTYRERIDDGGVVGYIIIALGSVTFLLALVRLLFVFLESRKVNSQKRSPEPKAGNALGRILGVYSENRDVDPETLELKLDEAVLRESARVERYLWAIKVVSVVAPLMGLLGTVTGMIRTFQAIQLFGAGDPKRMAGGISEALVTTMLGLCVAIPLVLLHSWINSMSKGVTDVLEEQSAGLIATRAEKDEGRGETA